MDVKTGKVYIARSFARADSLRDYGIYINNEKKGELKNGGLFSLELKSGTYNIELRIDWYRTKKITINIENGDILYLIGGSSLSKFKVTNIFKIFSKEKYIYLKILEKNNQHINKTLNESEIIEKIYKSDLKEYTMEDGIKDLKLRSSIYGFVWLILSIYTLNKTYENNYIINIIISVVSGLTWGIIWYFINKSKYKLLNKKKI